MERTGKNGYTALRGQWWLTVQNLCFICVNYYKIPTKRQLGKEKNKSQSCQTVQGENEGPSGKDISYDTYDPILEPYVIKSHT